MFYCVAPLSICCLFLHQFEFIYAHLFYYGCKSRGVFFCATVVTCRLSVSVWKRDESAIPWWSVLVSVVLFHRNNIRVRIYPSVSFKGSSGVLTSILIKRRVLQLVHHLSIMFSPTFLTPLHHPLSIRVVQGCPVGFTYFSSEIRN